MTTSLAAKKRKPAISDEEKEWDDRYPPSKFEKFNRRCAAAGKPMVLNQGLRSYGKFRYEPDGFIYKGRCKKPICRYLTIERLANTEVALTVGRLADIHELERRRWRMLTRIKRVLLPEMRRREREVRAYAKRLKTQKFSATVDGKVTSVEVGRQDCMAEVRTAEDPNLEVLDQLGNSFTELEADVVATRYKNIRDRLHRGWMASGVLTGCLVKALDLKLTLDRNRPYVEYGKFVEAKINGRVYAIWIGRGGYSRTSDDGTRHWPSPMNDMIDLDKPAAREPAIRGA